MITSVLLAGLVATNHNLPVPISQATLEAAAQNFQAETSLPGVWVAIASRGRFIGAASAGYADIASKTPTKVTNLLRVASVSKPIFGTMVGYCVQQGTLNYDDLILDCLTELKNDSNPEYSKVSLKMLLTHSSGIDKDQRTVFQTPPTADHYSSIRLNEVRTALKQPPLSQPGTQWHYANYGYQSAAVMVERKLSTTYESMLNQIGRKIFGLASIGSGTPQSDGVSGYSIIDNKAVQTPPVKTHFSYEYGAFGAVHINISDLVRFGLLYCPTSTSSPLSQKTLTKMESIVLDRQTLSGFQREEKPDDNFTLFHTGKLSVGRGDTTVLWINPKHGVVIAAHVNSCSKSIDEARMLQDKLVRPLFWQLCR